MLIAVALLCVTTGCTLSNLDMHAIYASYAEAEADGAIRRGWIPDFVPASATDNQESHNLDVNSQWVAFSFDLGDLPSMTAMLSQALRENVYPPDERATRKRPWWPKDLSPGAVVPDEKYDFYTYDYTVNYSDRQEKRGGYVAIEKHRPRAWYWTPCR